MSTKIKVKGTGQIKIKPDSIFINISLSSEDKEARKAFEKQKKAKQQLIKNLGVLKIKENDLKTSNLDLHPIYKTIQKNNNYEQILNGYRVTENMSLKLPMDIDFLNEVLLAINDLDEMIHFDVTFQNTQDHEKELLELAYKNALESATTLSNISNLEITEIDEIIENSTNNPIISQTLYKASLEIVPENIVLQKEIEVIFKAKKTDE